VPATCWVAKEVNAPPGVEPIEWRLLSNRAASTLAQAVELIDWYRARWEIELLFHVFKNGCRVEALQWLMVARLDRALTLYLIVAWRIARLMRLGRTCPDLEAALLFEREAWEAAYDLNQKKPSREVPRLNAVIRLIAPLGGFLGRKGDGEPSVKTLLQGLQRVMDFALGLRFARELQTE
jgi:hypothetical protein